MSWMDALVQMQLLKDGVPTLSVCTIPLWIIILHLNLMSVSLIMRIMILISIYDIKVACRRQKHGKATGPDDMAMEALLYGTNRLYTHLAILFNLFINFGHLPPGFMQSVMIPLVKKQIW